jgi:[acyl-carrier-protein] S-malonyltransferase
MEIKNIALVFPGQGSQCHKMGFEIYNNFEEAKRVFEEVSDAIDINIAKIIFEESEAELKKTENTQVALMTVSIAVLRVIEKLSGKKVQDFTTILAGHSLGEYSALVAGGSILLSDASKMLRKRGEFMRDAFPSGGAMLAIVGLELEGVTKLIQASKGDLVLDIANDNSTGQVVLSGNIEAIEKAHSLSKEYGARMSVKLEVSGPFHSKLLQRAQNQMREELKKYNIVLPQIKVINNLTANYYDAKNDINEILAKQITSQVKWRETIIKMEEEQINTVFEVGAGKVLCGLFKRTSPNIIATNIEKPAEIEKMVADLQ